MAHNRMVQGGWAREVTQRELPIATQLAGVNMRLKPGRVPRDALAQGGRVGVHARRQLPHRRRRPGGPQLHRRRRRGRPVVLPAGHPALDPGASEEGCEFLLVFDDGNFSENETFLITDWFAHTPRSVLAKNFGGARSGFARHPSTSSRSATSSRRGPAGLIDADDMVSPTGDVPRRSSHRMLAQEPIESAGGRCGSSTRRTSRAATTIAAALVEVEPGAHARAALAPERPTSGSTTSPARGG